MPESVLGFSRLGAFLRQPAPVKVELVRMLGTNAAIQIGLGIVPFPVLCRILGIGLTARVEEKTTRRQAGPPQGIELLPGYDAAIRAAQLLVKSRHPEGGCLDRALLLGHRFRSLQPILRFGVLPANFQKAGTSDSERTLRSAPPSGHAWLEIGGVALEDVGDFIRLRQAITS